AVDMDLEALPVQGRALQDEGCMKPEAPAIDGREGDLVVPGGGGREEALDRLHTEDSGAPVGGLRTQERQRGPGTRQDVRREEADATGAEAHGRRGQALDVCAVEAVTLQCLCGDAVGGGVGELGKEGDFGDRGCVRRLAWAAEVGRRDHLLTQWAHVVSPFVRRGVDWRRKTS